MFLPGLGSYYKKAKGCKVWDLNNKVYYDFVGMGVTSCLRLFKRRWNKKDKGLKNG